MINSSFCSLVLIIQVFLFTFGSWFKSNAQVILVDLEYDGRQLSELNEPGYSSWVISPGTFSTYTEDEITFEFVGQHNSNWYKAGVQAPHYARLVNDGMQAADVELRIKGLPSGKHTLLSFHNSYHSPENNTFAPIDIFVNDVQVYDDLEQSNRVTNDANAVISYISFSVTEGETAVFRFRAEPTAQTTDKVAYINGFELNTANSRRQSSFPYPVNRDEHANADAGEIRLLWKAAEDAIAHHFYFGTDESEVTNADHTSGIFIADQTDTSYLVQINNWKKYYWRVDEVYTDDTVKGDVWYFQPRHLAFSKAEGFGRFAKGGRGGQVLYVTNLDDDGPGSLREAVTINIGPRTIVFNVSGLITLQSRLVLSDRYVTVAGQTAPGKGICIRGAPFGLSGAEDCVIQHVRVRLGSGTTYDGMGMQGSDHCIIDHCSISWTIDEAFSSRSAKNITLQRTLISEPLNIAGHSNYPNGTKHGYAATISGDKGSFHHNLLAHSYGRNWSLGGGLDGNGFYSGRLDITNNVVYNFGSRTTDGGAHEVNFIANYYKPGPGHQGNNYALNAEYDNFPGTQQYYFTGNVMPGYFDVSNQEDGKRVKSGAPQGYSPWVDEPFFDSEIVIQPAYIAYKDILSDVGATSPEVDDHDIRIINETVNGTYTYTGSRSGIPGMPDSHEDVGGWEDYPENHRVESWDSDKDGLPDWWEVIYGSSITSAENDFSDANTDHDQDGYTMLEEYLEWMGDPHFFVALEEEATIDLSRYTGGYSKDPVYDVLYAEHGTATLQNDHEVIFSSSTRGFAGFIFKVTDAEGSSRQITVNAVVGVSPDGVVEPIIKELEPGDSTLLINEGGSKELSIRLSYPPSGAVVVEVTSSNPKEVTVFPPNLVFNTLNGRIPQMVTVTGVDDDIVDGTTYTDIRININTTSSSDYLDSEDKIVVVGNEDNDVLNILTGLPSIRVYPNPFHSKLFFTGNETVKAVFMYDISGKKILESEGILLSKGIDTSTLEKGVYLLKILTGRNEKSFRVIKN